MYGVTYCLYALCGLFYIPTLLCKKWLEARENYIYNNSGKLNVLLILLEQNFDGGYHFREIL